MRDDRTPATVRAARWIAALADLLQIVLLPAFFPGALSPASTAIDVSVAVVLVRLLGWHWAFLPTFIAEMTPFVDLVPTWTAAVFLATRAGAPGAAPELVVEAEARPIEPTRTLPAKSGQDRRDSSGE
jgi:hypothetical protein